jgi:hypothetical protein
VTYSRSVVSSGIPISSSNITNRHDINEILLKVALNNIAITQGNGDVFFRILERRSLPGNKGHSVQGKGVRCERQQYKVLVSVGHNFERDHPCQVWFNLVQWFQRKRFKCDLLSKYA